MFEYSGSTALVTGASKGLGAAFAEALAQRGMNLVLVARSTDELNVLSRRLDSKYNIQSTVLSVDLANSSSPHRIADELERRGIQVDLLVNNAGFGLSGKFLSHDFKQKQAEVEVNIQALVAFTHHFGKAMAARGKGGIINVASNAGFQPVPYMATYAATKAFVLHFSEAIRHELAGSGVQVMATCPGPTATSFFEGTSTHVSPKDMDSPESVVKRTLKAFDQKRAVAYPDGEACGWHRCCHDCFREPSSRALPETQPPRWVSMTDGPCQVSFLGSGNILDDGTSLTASGTSQTERANLGQFRRQPRSHPTESGDHALAPARRDHKLIRYNVS